MRHRKKKIMLGRSSSHRAAMLGNMVTSLFKHERIKTTDKKAQAAKRLAERLISFAREGSLASRRLAGRTVREARVLKKLFDDIGPRMKDRASGSVIVTKLWPRHGDGALMAVMELHGAKMKAKAVKGEKSKKTAAPAEKKQAPEKKEKRPKPVKKAGDKGKAEPGKEPQEKK
ncbi:MAG TPA: 50S ribosomal protein L17 [candidate division Zixibacteria bacterium]|jgi:large subunit ribosomal protein L17|nr:50S ribosomal protein L17 [candidate division Zixibacteria bacterium]